MDMLLRAMQEFKWPDFDRRQWIKFIVESGELEVDQRQNHESLKDLDLPFIRAPGVQR
jgi:hypothetical protein